MTTWPHKAILGSAILLTIASIAFLTSKRYGFEIRKKDSNALLLDMIANISGTIDKLNTGFDGMSIRTEVARNRLRQLVAFHREHAAICSILRKLRRMKTFEKTLKRT